MSAERKKLLWISIIASVFVLLVLATGFFLLAPKKGSAQAPATIGNSAPPKAQDPQDYLSAPPPTPSLEQPKSQDGSVIVVYGDKPTLPSPSVPGAAGSAPQAEAPASEGASAADKSAPREVPPSAAPAAPAQKAPSAKSAAPRQTAAKSLASKPSEAKPAMVRADQYWIQAGSFASRGRADELKQSLAEKGMAALITVKDASGKSLYRVRIGPYASEPEASGWLAKIKGLDGCSAAYVIKSIAKKAK
jgi:cell division protein FtsN